MRTQAMRRFLYSLDSSIDNLLQYRLYQSLLTLQTFLNFIWWTRCYKTVKPCNRPDVEAHKLG